MKRCMRLSVLSWLIIVLLVLGAKDSPLAGDSDIHEATEGDDLIQIDLVGSFDWSDSVVADFGIIDARALVEVPGAVWVLDVSNPASPVSAGYYPLEMDLTFASKGIGFVTDEVPMEGLFFPIGTTLEIYDITDPSTPVLGFEGEAGFFGNLTEIGKGFGCGRGSTCWEGEYESCTFYGYILDLTDLQSVVTVHHYPEDIIESCWPSPACYCGDYLLFTSERIYDLEFGFEIYDKSLTLLGSCDLPTSPNVVGESGTKAYAIDPYNSVIHIIDVVDAAAPVYEATYDLPPSTEVIHYADGYVYLTGGSSDLQILDVANPLTVGFWDSPGDSVIGIQVVGDIIWVGDEAGLYALSTTLIPCCGYYHNGITGNTDCSENGAVTLADISRLIDHVYISKEPLCCKANGNVNGSPDGEVSLSDISRLIDHVYISKTETASCN